MEIRIAATVKESVVDGPGLRFVIFAQGCRHRCIGCHNPDTWEPLGGIPVEIADLLEQIKNEKLIKGVTFSGGEPFLQAGPLARLGRQVKAWGLDLITYTGYTWEKLLTLQLEDQGIKELLLVSDYVVDGPFITEERDFELPFRGSRNQRIIDVKSTMSRGEVVEAGFF
ncbi:MAG: anaerobic ribonucleoside-triphosphate reductase activating protein [Desulfotomaculaceae bacterium]|nr:anaerobic ribonucleoside-triphosphate reductase activating protein [Desulfotomaculaceae bacterium]